MIVVSNASPLVGLATIGQIDLLPKLYGQIYVPEAVYREVVLEGAGRPGSTEVGNATWIERKAIVSQATFNSIRHGIHIGEAEAITLALDLSADLVLLDDLSARMRAEQLGLIRQGVVGILQEGRLRGVILEIKPHLDRLRASGFRLSAALYNRVLRDAGEQP